ncbi:MAG: gliding motility-associated C-terminal domain-containing protein [Chitinophagaceae bacterium]
MGLKLLRLLAITGFFIFLSGSLKAQNCIPTNINGTTFNFVCNQVCNDLNFQIPHIKGTDDYVVSSIPYQPYPYVTAAPALTLPCGNQDDKYFDITTMPFSFCYYGNIYNSLVVSTNGSVTFDLSNALKGSNWSMNTGMRLPFEGVGGQGSGTCPTPSGTRLPKAGIFGAYCDIFPQTGDPYKIEARTEGVSPCRKFVISFSQVQMFGCSSVRMTSEIVLHESTGIIEIFIENKPSCSSNGGLAIVGIQNYDLGTPAEKAVTAPGRGAENGAWSTTNEAWRFTPSGSGSRYVKAELYDLSGTLIATADTATTVAGLLDVKFRNVCPPAGSTQYEVRTTFSACDNPANLLVSSDFITVNKTNSLGATATSTPASCGPPNGTITVTVPAGVGTAPYTFILDGGTPFVGASPHTFTNVAAGSHTIVVTDASTGCTSTFTHTVSLSGILSETHTVTPTPCSGVNSGSIRITSAGGVGPYTFVIDGGAPINGTIPFTFSNLWPGTHNIIVTDITTGCTTGVFVVDVPQGLGITGETATTPTTCPGVNSGTITAKALTGTAPFTWSLDGGAPVPGATPFTFTNVSGGSHVVTIRDNFGCSVTVPADVATGATPTATATSTPTACTGVNNGTITVDFMSIPGPYTFSLDGGAPQAGTIPFTFTNVSPGSHSIVVTGAGGCATNPFTQTVLTGAGVNGTATPSASSCPSATNGSIRVDATTGTAPFTYQLDGGAPQSGANPYTFNGVAPGSHTILIRDNLGCTFTLNGVIVNAGPALTVTTSSSATSCSGAANGSITVTPNGGTAPFTWSLNGGPPVAGTSPYTFTNLAAGSYIIVVTDASGCANSPVTETVAAGPALTVTTSASATSCSSAANGSITVTPNGGTAPFTWSLNGGAPVAGTSPYTFTNLAAGSYTIVVTDASGCANNPVTETVAAGPALTVTTSASATSCNSASNGSITVTPNSGSAPFTWSLDGGAPVAGTSPYTFSNLVAGSHTIVVTDAAGCANTPVTETVPAGPALITTATTTDVLCKGGNTGVITVAIPTIGTPPYQYSLDNISWQSSNIFNGLSANSYTVYFRESNGCQGSLLVTVNEPALLTAAVSEIPVVCNGQNNGTITVTPAGGIGPYQYSIDGGVTWQGSNIFNVAANSYTITIKDANNCITTQTITVTEPAVLAANSINTTASCDGGPDGTITVTANGGNAGYTYSLDGTTFQSSNTFNVLPGSYTVTVKDNLGCSISFPAIVTLMGNLTFTPQADPTICEGKSTALQLVSNATSYAWTPTNGLSDPASSSPVANPTVTTEYYVEATLGLCKAYDTVKVNVNAAPVPDAGPGGFICYGQTYTLQGSGGIQYLWSPSTYLNNATAPNAVSTPLKTTTYNLSIVSDLNGCNSLVTDDVIVDVTPPIKVTTFPYDTIGYPGDQFQLNATSAATNYTWTPTTGLSNPGVPNPVVTVGNIGDDIVYKVTASTAAGCKGEGFVRIRVYTGPDIYVPTAFTPNGDGRNDKFYPFPVGIKSINYFRVFNRWGQQVFSSTKLNDGWDGKLGGVEQSTGTYVWMAQAVTKDNKVITKKGSVTIIR